jgi:lysophospholipase L1-like esterase
MKSILCYGDSNTWGCIPLEGQEPAGRFPPDTRWPGVLRRELGEGHWIVEEGLSGRTTVWDDPLEPHRNGRKLLLPTLLTHQPLDLVIIMLGTNDLKHRMNASAAEIAAGAGMLVDIVAASGCGPNGGAPQTLVVCPAPIAEVDQFDDQFEGGTEKSRRLAGHFAAIAEARSCAFLDAGAFIESSDIDGIHLDEPQHAALGAAIAKQVRPLLA